MDLTNQLLQRINDTKINHNERTMLRCRLAKELEEAGNYEAARNALGQLWQRVGESPRLEGLDQHTTAEVLLRAGALSGWLGSAERLESAHLIAKNLISESISIFQKLADKDKAAEALTELAYCYWREGAYDEAQIILNEVLGSLEDDSELKALALLRNAIVISSKGNYDDALKTLLLAAPLFSSITNHALKGRFHANFGGILRKLGENQDRDDYKDRALIELAAASFHFENAGANRLAADVEKNLGIMFSFLGYFSEARNHLIRARHIFELINESDAIAEIDNALALSDENQNLSKGIRITNVGLMRWLAKHPEDLLRVHPETFEQVVAELFRNQGFDVEIIGRWNQADGGIDIIAAQKNALVGEFRIGVQCKRYVKVGKVRSDLIWALEGRLNKFHLHKGVLATTARIERAVLADLSQYLWRIELKDFNSIKLDLEAWGSFEQSKGGIWLPQSTELDGVN